jgi:hypothetical protein
VYNIALLNTGEGQYVEKLGAAETRTVAEALSISINVAPISLDVSNIHAIQRPEFAHDLFNLSIPRRQNVLSGLLATAISEIPSDDEPSERERPLNFKEDEMCELRFVIVLFGYGYGNRSTSVWLATAVMTTYTVITIAYIAYILVPGSTSTAWNSAIELVALALQPKKPDHLGNTGEGLDSIETFKEGVGIRVNQDDELELVFAHDRDIGKRGLRKIERNKEY